MQFLSFNTYENQTAELKEKFSFDGRCQVICYFEPDNKEEKDLCYLHDEGDVFSQPFVVLCVTSAYPSIHTIECDIVNLNRILNFSVRKFKDQTTKVSGKCTMNIISLEGRFFQNTYFRNVKL